MTLMKLLSRLRFLPVILIGVIFLGSCEKIKIGKSFECHMGTSYKVTSNLSFKINSLNDSRCPPRSVCAVPGEVHIFININQANNIVDTVLYQDPTSNYPVQFGEYGFSLLDVVPISIGTTTSKDITIKMIITKL
jgi:hypothetical protein